jgi:hypothetical protein
MINNLVNLLRIIAVATQQKINTIIGPPISGFDTTSAQMFELPTEINACA